MYSHVEIKESSKGANPLELGASLSIGSQPFEDMDEIIARFIERAFCSHAATATLAASRVRVSICFVGAILDCYGSTRCPRMELPLRNGAKSQI